MTKISSITSDGITFDDGTTISDHHEQNCCENVFADCEALRDTGILDTDFSSISINGRENAGITISDGDRWGQNNYFVPCYSRQNGYYSSALNITVRGGNTRVSVDISDFVKCEHD